MSGTRLAALAAVAVVGGVLWWLLGTGAAPEKTHGMSDGASPPAAVAESPTAPSSTPESPSVESAGSEEPAGVERDLPAAKPMDDVHCTAVLEDGTPLPGVQSRFAGPSGGWFSAPGSEFEIPRPERSAEFTHRHADLAAVEGGAIQTEGIGHGIYSVRVDSDRLRLVFRDRPGTAHVRLVNAATGAPVTDISGLRESWEFPGGVLAMKLEKDPGLGGWIPILEGRLPEAGGVDPASIRVDPAKVTLVLAMPGYEAARLPLPEVRGRREVRVNPVEPDARGEVRVFFKTTLSSGPPVGPDRVTARIRSLDSPAAKVPEDLLGLPTKPGPFALYGLPDGAWEIEVLGDFTDPNLWKIEVDAASTNVRGRRAFEKRGGTAEIGTIELRESGMISVRVVDAAGAAMPQASVIAVRPEEDPDQGRPFHPDHAGRVVVADLEPGVDHRVQVRGLPRLLEQSVRATPAAEAKDVEFRWPEKLVPCRIALVVDGRVVANPDGSRTIPASVHESPLPRDKGSWGPDGTFEAPLVPGTYRFSVYATPKEGTGLALFSGEVTVPGGEAFETRLELRREP